MGIDFHLIANFAALALITLAAPVIFILFYRRGALDRQPSSGLKPRPSRACCARCSTEGDAVDRRPARAVLVEWWRVTRFIAETHQVIRGALSHIALASQRQRDLFAVMTQGFDVQLKTSSLLPAVFADGVSQITPFRDWWIGSNARRSPCADPPPVAPAATGDPPSPAVIGSPDNRATRTGVGWPIPNGSRRSATPEVPVD